MHTFHCEYVYLIVNTYITHSRIESLFLIILIRNRTDVFWIVFITSRESLLSWISVWWQYSVWAYTYITLWMQKLEHVTYLSSNNLDPARIHIWLWKNSIILAFIGGRSLKRRIEDSCSVWRKLLAIRRCRDVGEEAWLTSSYGDRAKHLSPSPPLAELYKQDAGDNPRHCVSWSHRWSNCTKAPQTTRYRMRWEKQLQNKTHRHFKLKGGL